MKRMRLPFASFLIFFTGWSAFSAQFSRNLSPSDVDKITEVLGFGGATRLMRSAEPYESFPGIKIGIETALTPGAALSELGDQSGSMPGLIPAPRLYLAKGLFKDVEMILTFFTPTIWDTLSSVGTVVKWTFFNESSNFVSAAAYAGYTHLSAFRNVYKGHDIETGAYFSKDYVRLKPYFGAGMLFANGNIMSQFAPVKQSAWATTFHFFLGLEFELPVNFTMQIDVMNTTPQGSILIAKKF
jgi:hypothetical protein